MAHTNIKFIDFITLVEQEDKDDDYWRDKLLTDFGDLFWANPRIEYIRAYTKCVENEVISKYYDPYTVHMNYRKIKEYFNITTHILDRFKVSRDYNTLYGSGNAIGPYHCIEQIKRSKDYIYRNFDLIFYKSLCGELFIFFILKDKFILLRKEKILEDLQIYFGIFMSEVTINSIRTWYKLTTPMDLTKFPFRTIEIDSL